ncbi:copper amine oxidase N-terminal domain-containing protein [Paenibacillus timonensis]|uniref:Copper amine oxidase N-terminal domain-containing protein n=1 Tax=Paenibacillus timonensis TaxID=225915 RepID=A0ABW3SA34_9BACL|nr:copper amine oxidase N-terminal domain-containing protein [Paenibacillus timonensis]MCH1642958.1 copper amine oxidase N-terminal domain-containing protein [Paenibacillus timonensis]
MLMIGLWGFILLGTSIGQVANAATSDIPKVKNMSIEVLVNARRVAFPDVRPQIKNGNTLIPLRFVTDKLAGKLTLSGKNISIEKGDRLIAMTIGGTTATVNGETVTLDTPSVAVDGRTLVPLRFVSEALGEPVKWDSVNQYIWIGSTEVPKLEDVAKPVSIEPYLDLFKKGEYVLKFGNITYSQVRILRKDDFPIQFENEIIYRIDYAQTTDKTEFLRSISDSKSQIGTNYYLMKKGEPLRYRGEIVRLRERTGQDSNIRIKYHQIIARKDEDLLGDKNYLNLTLKNIDYVGLDVDSDAAVFVKNEYGN